MTATIAPLANRAASYMGVDMLEVIGAAIFVAFIELACSDVDAVQAPLDRPRCQLCRLVAMHAWLGVGKP